MNSIGILSILTKCNNNLINKKGALSVERSKKFLEDIRSKIISSKSIAEKETCSLNNDNWININFHNNKTLLHIAIESKLYKVAELLLKSKNIDINLQDKNGNIPLHWAVYHNNQPIVELLITNNVALNSQNHNGDTPLHFAVRNESEILVKFLIASKANPWKKNIENKNPINLSNSNSQCLQTIYDNFTKSRDIGFFVTFVSYAAMCLSFTVTNIASIYILAYLITGTFLGVATCIVANKLLHNNFVKSLQLELKTEHNFNFTEETSSKIPASLQTSTTATSTFSSERTNCIASKIHNIFISLSKS